MSSLVRLHTLTPAQAAQTLFFESSIAHREEAYWRAAHGKWTAHLEQAVRLGRLAHIPAMKRCMSQSIKRADWWRAVAAECERQRGDNNQLALTIVAKAA